MLIVSWQDTLCKVAGYSMQGGRMQKIWWHVIKIISDINKLIPYKRKFKRGVYKFILYLFSEYPIVIIDMFRLMK